MKKSTKGALAAAAAGTLLLGGAGSLAFWSADQSIGGTSIAAGHLKIVDQTCATATWKLDDGVDYTTQKIVPGDTLTKTCTFKIDGLGNHMTVALDTATPTWDATNALTNELTVGATFTGDIHGAIADNGTVAKNETVTAVITVDFPGAAATNASNDDFTALLNGITLTANQGHSA